MFFRNSNTTKMFCSNCGNNVNGKFCLNYGNAAKKEAPSFLDFLKGKQLDRESQFKTKKMERFKVIVQSK